MLISTYGSYGEIQQPVSNAPGASAYPYLYTGQFYDTFIQAYDYKARLFSPALGRFLQPDPIGMTDDVNPYSYAGNEPTDGRDPSGTERLNSVPATMPITAGRSIVYALMDASLHDGQSAKPTNFFAAAAAVTGPAMLAGYEAAPWLVTPHTAFVISRIGAALYQENTSLYFNLYDGKNLGSFRLKR